MSSDTKNRPGIIFYLIMFLVVIVTMVMHEIVHWIAGTALGYEMYFQLTKAGLVDGVWRSEGDYALVSIAGPVFTFALGAFGAWLAIARRVRFGYELIFTAFMQRALAMGMSAIFIPNDEARVSLYLGLPWWVLPLVFVAPLLALTIWASRALRFGWLVNFLCYVTVSLAFTLVVFADGQLVGFEGVSVLEWWLP
jgi:hypothetical protein